MRAIVVGLGGWGSSSTRVIGDGGWDIAAWVDVNPAALERAVTNLSAEPGSCYATLDEALANVDADAVLICTPPDKGRARDIVAAMDAGLHVLVDKPLTTTPEEMATIVEAHRKSSVKFMVAQNYRWYPGAELMRRTIESGELGPLGYANVYYHMAENMRGHHIVEMAHGLVLGMCVHHLDLMRFVTGAEPETIWARTWNPPWSWTKADACAESLITFDGSVAVNYFAGWAAHHSATGWFGQWHLEFEHGALLTDGVKSSIVRDGQRTEIEGPEIDPPNYTRAGVLREFTSAIEEDRTPECSVEDNARTMQMAFDIIESAEHDS